jgi:two-component sensor histidine kinase
VQQDYPALLQRRVAISVGIASILLAAISFVRLISYYGDTPLQALVNVNVTVVIAVGLLFLGLTLKSHEIGRIIQIVVSYLIACGTALDSSAGDLTSTVFLIAALMLAYEYGLLTKKTRIVVVVGIPLALYVGCFFVGSYVGTGAVLASFHVLLGAGLASYLFLSIIGTRLRQVQDREDVLETKVAQRTEGLRREVKRRAVLEEDLRKTATTSQRLAADRALLLHELHHRTKNDLQLIASMIRLHGEDDLTSTRQELLAAAEDRIMAIALVHEYLYSSEKFSAIGLSDYLDGLIAHLRSAHSGSAINIDQDIQTSLSVAIEPAIHLGLAINELVQNARKHAFPDGRSGTVTISAKETGETLELIVSDDGIGIVDSPDDVQRGSIGIEIVRGLVSQLDGEISLDTAGQTRWVMILPQATLIARAPGKVSPQADAPDSEPDPSAV